MKLNVNDLVYAKWGRYHSGPLPFSGFYTLGGTHTTILEIYEIGKIIKSDVWPNNPHWPKMPYYIIQVNDRQYVCYDNEIEPLFNV